MKRDFVVVSNRLLHVRRALASLDCPDTNRRRVGRMLGEPASSEEWDCLEGLYDPDGFSSDWLK